MSIAFCSWGPQSQRVEPKTSPVRHCECTRTRIGVVRTRLAHHQGDVGLSLSSGVIEGMDRPLAHTGRQVRGGDTLSHQALVAHAVADQVGDRHQFQAVLLGETRADAFNRAIVPSSFMISQIDRCRPQAGETAQIDGGLRVARAPEYAPGCWRHAAGRRVRGAPDPKKLASAGRPRAASSSPGPRPRYPVVTAILARPDRDAERRARRAVFSCTISGMSSS